MSLDVYKELNKELIQQVQQLKVDISFVEKEKTSFHAKYFEEYQRRLKEANKYRSIIEKLKQQINNAYKICFDINEDGDDECNQDLSTEFQSLSLKDKRRSSSGVVVKSPTSSNNRRKSENGNEQNNTNLLAIHTIEEVSPSKENSNNSDILCKGLSDNVTHRRPLRTLNRNKESIETNATNSDSLSKTSENTKSPLGNNEVAIVISYEQSSNITSDTTIRSKSVTTMLDSSEYLNNSKARSNTSDTFSRIWRDRTTHLFKPFSRNKKATETDETDSDSLSETNEDIISPCKTNGISTAIASKKSSKTSSDSTIKNKSVKSTVDNSESLVNSKEISNNSDTLSRVSRDHTTHLFKPPSRNKKPVINPEQSSSTSNRDTTIKSRSTTPTKANSESLNFLTEALSPNFLHSTAINSTDNNEQSTECNDTKSIASSRPRRQRHTVSYAEISVNAKLRNDGNALRGRKKKRN